MSELQDRVQLQPSWKSRIGGEFEQEYMQNLRQFLIREKEAGKVIYPEGKKNFQEVRTDLGIAQKTELVAALGGRA